MLTIGERLEAAERDVQALRQASERQWPHDLPVDHIGLAVPPAGLETALRTWSLLGYRVAERDLVTSQKAWAAMLRPGGDVRHPGPGLELVIPALELESAEVAAAFEAREVVPGMSAITQYLVRNRPGLHHIAFTVPEGSIRDFRAHLIDVGVEVIGDNVRPGAFGTIVFFTKPDRGSPDQPGPSVLIEYVDTVGVQAWRQQYAKS
jgi:catechol 2,3-dioxygenase-like lactoylglutathione lyase family enzyme